MKMLQMFLLLILTAVASRAQESDVKVRIGEVSDRRTTGEFFAGFEIKLRITGDSLGNAKQMRGTIQRAVDDTGRDLLDAKKESKDFQEIRSFNSDRIDHELRLRNPSRRAASVKEITGELEFFAPKNDPDAIVTLNRCLASAGEPLTNPALKAAEVTLAVLNKEKYDALKAQKTKEAKEAAAKAGVANEMTDALGKAFAGLFSGFMQVGENNLAIQLQDPKSRVVSIEFMDGQGKTVESRGRSWSGDLSIYQFDQKPSPDWSVRVLLLTPKSLIKVPIKFTDVELP